MGENAQQFIEELAKKNLASQQRRKDILKEHGYPEDYLDAEYTCKKCRDTGFIGGVMCDCYKALLRDTALAELNELSPSARSTFESFNINYYPDTVDPTTGINPRSRMKEILDFCRDYAADFATDSPSLLLYGATGLGKTHLSLAIASEAVKKGYGVIYGSAQNLMSRLEKEHFSSGRNSEYEGSEQALLECDLLIIDDLGAEFSTQFTVAELYNIINTRIMSRLPVIISTNLTPDGLEQKYTQRITSRIIGNYISLYFCGKDIRQIKNTEQEY